MGCKLTVYKLLLLLSRLAIVLYCVVNVLFYYVVCEVGVCLSFKNSLPVFYDL